MKSALAAIAVSMLFSFSALANETQSKLIALKTVEVNGESIQLAMTVRADGKMCAQYIESIQFLAYGENVYEIGNRCTKILPKTERT